MAPRGKTLFLAFVLVVAALVMPGAARGQVAAPRLVEDEAEMPEAPPSIPAPGGERHPRAAEAPPAAREAPAAKGSRSAPPAPGPGPEGGGAAVAQPSAAPALPPPPPPPASAADLARRIVPVQTSWARLMGLWTERRNAYREADRAQAEAAERDLLAARRELAIENLVVFSAAEVREARRAQAANLYAEAVARASVAVELAPDNPDAHLALARARLAAAPGEPGPALSALASALAAVAREPHAVRALYGDLAGAALAAVFTASIATILLLFLRRARLFFHDFHHLPLVRGTAFLQASFLAVVLLGMPFAFGLGPIAVAAVALLAVWLHLGFAERLVGIVALLALLGTPWAAGRAARLTAWTGSVAEQVYDIEQGALSDAQVAEITAAWSGSPAPAPLLAALGRHHKRRGNLREALRLYELAAASDDRAPELQVNIGNVLFLEGDVEGAKAAYLAATDRALGDLVVLGAAHYDLSKLYLRTSDMEKSAAAREMAEREAGEFLRKFGSDDDFSANRYLVDVPVPREKISALTVSDGSPAAVETWVRRRIAGVIPPAFLTGGALALLGLLGALALASRRIAPATACEKCGRPACRRCDGAAAAHCGQCVNVFHRKGVVDARDRLRKEAQVRRHVHLRSMVARILSIVGGGAGQVWHGAPVRGALFLLALLFAGFLLWFWRGVIPPPQPSPHALLGKLVVAAPLGIVVWALAIRDAFRRTQ